MGMNKSKLPSLKGPEWQRYSVWVAAGKYTSGLATGSLAAATSQNIPLMTKPKNSVLHAVVVKHATAFAGTAISACTASVGTASDATAVAEAFDVLQAVGPDKFYQNGGVNMVSFADTALIVQLVSTGANLSALTAGFVDVWVLVSYLP